MFSKSGSKIKIVPPGHDSWKKGGGTGGFDGLSGCRGVQFAEDHKSDGTSGSGEGVVFVVGVSVVMGEGENWGPCIVLAGDCEDGSEVSFAAVGGVSSISDVNSCIREKGVDDMVGLTGVPGVGGLEEDGVVAPGSALFLAELKSFYIRVGCRVGGKTSCQVAYGTDNAAKVGVGGGCGAWGLGERVRFDVGAVVTAKHGEEGVMECG